MIKNKGIKLETRADSESATWTIFIKNTKFFDPYRSVLITQALQAESVT